MGKNSRKQRRTRVPPAAPKVYCPRSMVRYDKCVGDYPTKWVCRNCIKVLLSKEAVINHLNVCSGKSRPPNQAPPENDDPPYICKYCDKIFERRVLLKMHLGEHENHKRQ